MKNYVKNNIKAVEEYLNGLTALDLVDVWNEYTREHDGDREIFSNDEDFFNTYFENRVMDAVRAIFYGDYNYSHEFVMFNGYANLETTNSPEDWIDISELAQAIIDNPGDFYDIELEDENEEEEAE
jgi:hypothetical protein